MTSPSNPLATETVLAPKSLCGNCQVEWARMRGMHVESERCWCHPTLDFVAENGNKVWVHHEPN